MTGVVAVLAAGRKLSPITVDVNWGSDSSPSPVSSIAATLTVPAGNPGSVRFAVDASTGGTQAYIKNGGAPSAFVNGTTITVANGDTLALAYSATIGNSASFTIYDDTRSTAIGTWSASIS